MKRKEQIATAARNDPGIYLSLVSIAIHHALFKICICTHSLLFVYIFSVRF